MVFRVFGSGVDGQGGSWESLGLPPASSLLCCKPASGPIVCSEGCGRGSACAGSAAAGHSRLLAEGTKEEEKREEDVAVLSLQGGKEGTTEKRPLVGQSAGTQPAAPGNCCRHAGDVRPVPQYREPGKGGVEGKFRSSPLGCCAVFPQPLIDCCLRRTFPSVS